MTVFLYSETDGDAGAYHLRLFTTRTLAEAYRRLKQSSYAHVEELTVHAALPYRPVPGVLHGKRLD